MSGDASLVFVIDDDPSIRASLEGLLRSAGQPVRCYESTAAFLEAERPDVPACLVLDVRLPCQSGLEFQRELARRGPALPIVFITGHGDIPMSVAAMKAGAIEFLTKPFRDQDLLAAVAQGLERDRVRRRQAASLQELRERYDSLTAREREVLALVVQGLMNKQIAGDLGLAEITVKVHRASLMRKMRVRSLAELVRIADRLAREAAAPL